MSTYYVNKFLYQVDGDPDLLAAYKTEPAALVQRWENERGRYLGIGNRVETTSWLEFTAEERRALVEHDYVALFEQGAHFFLTLTIFVGLFEEDYLEEKGPLAFQLEYAAKLDHWRGRDYPSVEI